ncbi:DUF4255 domain-containing protein [Streptomyces sp. NBC_01381]|uniref:DUF4255 domain-containing protein n=1 Tax=Streptomyces sp. NBC_01381 TaxID=2903845 RepID=UPI00225112E1|nr:DUF4255 domain-containing protein [Streptomyces sp. NBC_01381]MCX4673196.1 DUF4255 domain-containing protein [Streptomyces sp. NBC_01381]
MPQPHDQGVIAVGSPDVIADVSDILLQVLTAAVHESDPTAQVRLVELVGQQQGGGGGTLGLELFLYEVTEDPSTRNRPPRRTVVEDPVSGAILQERRRADMALLLRYLVIPTGKTPDAQQRLLGSAMRALYDHAILQAPQLVAAAQSNSVADAGEPLTLRLAPLSLDERAKVWWAIAQPYRLSLNYEVRVVNLASRDITTDSAVTGGAVDVGQIAGVRP